MLGVAPEQMRAALGDRAAAHNPDMALWLVTGASTAATPELRAPDIVLPWSADPGAEVLARRREALQSALKACRFRDAPWFADLAAALDRAADRLGPPETGQAATAPILMEDAS